MAEENKNEISTDKSQVQNGGVETYVKDMAKVIESNKDGLLKKIISEQEKYEDRKYQASPQAKKNKKFLAISLFLIFSAIVVLVLFAFLRKENTTVDVQLQFQPIIFTDKTEFKEVGGYDKDAIANSVLGEINATDIKQGEIEGIYLTNNKSIVGFRKFINLIGSYFISGDELILKDNFLMGVSYAETKDFFILFKIRSLLDIFTNIQAWESKMFYDLHGFFGIDITSDTDYLLNKGFEDDIVENKNARVLFDKDHNIVMMYVYADNKSVLITNTKKTASEIMLRLTPGQIRK